MAAAKLGDLLAAQVERSNAKQAIVVQFAATIPGDGSPVSLDWWLQRMNQALRDAVPSVPIQLDYADLDNPAQKIGETSPIQVMQLKRQIAELQALVNDYEETMRDKAAALAEKMVTSGEGIQADSLSKKEKALRAVDNDGVFVDEKGGRWVSIETEALRTGTPYITLWRACKGRSPNHAEAWVVGKVQAGGDRILIKEGSFSAGKRRKKAKKS
jgi:hypothetical protein